MSRALIALALAALLATPALAHRLSIFASRAGGEVVVEAKFSNGNPAQTGTVKVYDAADRLIRTLELGSDGTARFPLAGETGGLRIEVDTGHGHSDYWILTPEDLATETGG